MKGFWVRLFGGFRGLFFIFIVGVGLSLHLYTQHIVNQLRDETRSLVLLYAQMYAWVADAESAEDVSFIFDHIIRRTNFPLINTDPERVPIWWKGISVDSYDRSEEAIQKVQRMVFRLDKQIDPVPVRYGDTVLGYLYYGDSKLVQQLQWLPYLEVGIVGFFILVGFIGYANIKRSEQRHIWVGMAKETAHQLGTPLSSMMGWLEVMRSKKRLDVRQITDEIERDLERLQKVTRRFSQIGSKPDLKQMDIRNVLREVVEYVRRRAPQLGRRVEIVESFSDVPKIALNPDLFQWAVENVMRNSLDAMDKDEGAIQVTLGFDPSKKRVFVDIRDNGKGMDSAQAKHIFRPGYSTKQRGWGLGLTLAQRIIREYHRGNLFVKETKPGEGTTIRIALRS